MNRRDFIKSASAVAVASVVADSGRAQGVPPPSKRPNILLVFSDQQHWQAMGFMDPFFQTPSLDQLATESMVFERAFCTTPQCSPSRSSLLTGFYPSSTGVIGNVGSAGGDPLAQPTLAPELQAAGYRTGYFGKWHLGDKEEACAGWDEHIFKTDDSVAAKGALGFLKAPETQSQPFALVVSINNPHDIYQFKKHQPTASDIPLPLSWSKETFEGKPPIQKEFMERDQGRAINGQPRAEWERYHDCYREKTRLYDSHLGKIIDELKRQGQWDNTVVIATSDHGDMDTQHKLIFKGPFMYEHMVRIPLMIRLPKCLGGRTPRRVTDLDVVNVDIVPTLRELCSIPEKASHGRSLVPVLTGRGAYRPRDFVVGQYYSKQRWVNPIRMIRTDRYKLNRHIRWGDELYDLVNDPHELTNLADDPRYTETKKELAATLDRWISEHKDPFLLQEPTTRSGAPIHE